MAHGQRSKISMDLWFSGDVKTPAAVWVTGAGAFRVYGYWLGRVHGGVRLTYPGNEWLGMV